VVVNIVISQSNKFSGKKKGKKLSTYERHIILFISIFKKKRINKKI
jgi:hypothetical protein